MQVAHLVLVHIHASKNTLLKMEFHNDQPNLLYSRAHGQDLRQQAIARLADSRIIATARHLVEHSLDTTHLTLDTAQPGLCLLV